MKCKHVQQKLVDYSESLVDQKTRLLIEEHLQSCSECAQELKDFEETVSLLQSVPIQEPPETFWADFTSDVMQRIERMDDVSSARPWLFFPSFRMAAVAAAVLLFVVGSLFFFSTGTIQKVFPAFFPASTQLLVESPEQSSQELTELSLSAITPEELVNDILESDLALIGKDPAAIFEGDASDDIVRFLIEHLSEEEKDRLLEELYQMK